MTLCNLAPLDHNHQINLLLMQLVLLVLFDIF